MHSKASLRHLFDSGSAIAEPVEAVLAFLMRYMRWKLNCERQLHEINDNC